VLVSLVVIVIWSRAVQSGGPCCCFAGERGFQDYETDVDDYHRNKMSAIWNKESVASRVKLVCKCVLSTRLPVRIIY
jgi:hypothetical protein